MTWASGRRQRSARQRITLNLTSMIDVTFLILIYFLVTSVLAEREDQLRSALQTETGQASSSDPDLQPQVVEVALDGGRPVYRLAARRFEDAAALAAALEGLPKQLGLVLRVEPGVSVGFAVAGMQAARDAGFEVTYVPAR